MSGSDQADDMALAVLKSDVTRFWLSAMCTTEGYEKLVAEAERRHRAAHEQRVRDAYFKQNLERLR